MIINVSAKENIKTKNIEIIDNFSVTINNRNFELINNIFHEIKEVNFPQNVYYDGEKISVNSKVRVFTGEVFTIEELNNLIKVGV